VSAQKHTPGPLDWLSISASGGTGFHLYLTDSNGRKIGVCWGKAEEKVANANLFTAAPDLLNALKVCREAETERRAKLLPGAPATTYTEKRLALIDAAIAKAEGGEG